MHVDHAICFGAESHPRAARCAIVAAPKPEISQNLSVSANVKSRGCDPRPLMLIEDHVFDQDGAPLHVSKQVLRGDKHQYSMHMPRVVG